VLLCGSVDGAPDALIGSTTTKVPGERSIDIRISGSRVLRQESGSRHQLPRLTIPTLGDFFGDPGALQGMAAVKGETLNRRHRPISKGGNGSLARADGRTAQMHGTGTTESDAAAKLGASQPKKITQRPEEGHVRVIECDNIWFPVDGDSHVCHMISFVHLCKQKTALASSLPYLAQKCIP
jgi:hypothetical protein